MGEFRTKSVVGRQIWEKEKGHSGAYTEVRCGGSWGIGHIGDLGVRCSPWSADGTK